MHYEDHKGSNHNMEKVKNHWTGMVKQIAGHRIMVRAFLCLITCALICPFWVQAGNRNSRRRKDAAEGNTARQAETRSVSQEATRSPQIEDEASKDKKSEAERRESQDQVIYSEKESRASGEEKSFSEKTSSKEEDNPSAEGEKDKESRTEKKDKTDETGKAEKDADNISHENEEIRNRYSKKNCRIYVKNLIMDASDICRQTVKLSYTCPNKEKPQYFSDSDVITVEEGKVIVPPNYAGTAHITVIIPESEEYVSASTRILVAVNKIENPLKVFDIVEDYNEEERTIPLETEVRGRAPLIYKSSDKGITIDHGRASIRKGYSGTAEVSVTAKATGIYKETSKNFKITVLSGIAEKLYDAAKSQIGISGGGMNSTKYGQFTGMNHQAWCASFVSWCANESGVESAKPGMRSVLPKTASTLEMCQYSTDYHVWSKEALQMMKRGDVIFFSRAEKQYQVGGSKSVCHVGIIESIDPSSSSVNVIEGNSTGDRVCRHTYHVDPESGRIRKRYFCGYINVH